MIATIDSKPISQGQERSRSDGCQSQHACLFASFNDICSMWQSTRYVQGRQSKASLTFASNHEWGPQLISVALHPTRKAVQALAGRQRCVCGAASLALLLSEGSQL